MSEDLLQFGDDQRLSGVLRRCSGAAAPGLLLLNAGVVHRIGPNRLNVKIARAYEGPSLRFDLSGLGDSARSADAKGVEEQHCADISAAIDSFLKAVGERQVVIAGLCSGADNAMCAALSDERIASLVLLDPYAYPNKAAQRADMAARLSDPDRWSAKLARMTERSVERPAKTADVDADLTEKLEQGRPVPPKEEFASDLQALIARGVSIKIVYTGLVRRHVSKTAHFFETFADCGFEGKIDVSVMGDTDHTFTTLASQQRLLQCVSNWLRPLHSHERAAS